MSLLENISEDLPYVLLPIGKNGKHGKLFKSRNYKTPYGKKLKPAIYIAVVIYTIVVMKGVTASEHKEYPSEIYPAEILKFQEDVKKDIKIIMEKNNLKIGKACVHSQEAERKAILKALLSHTTMLYMKPHNMTEHTDDLKVVIEKLAKLDGPFCDMFDSLECNLDGECDCAKEGESVGFKVFFEREVNKCVLKPGSMCAPQEIVDDSSRNSIFGPLRKHTLMCSSDTSCIVKSHHGQCTPEAMRNEFDRMTASHGDTNHDMAYKIEKASQGICICQGAHVEISIFIALTYAIASFYYFMTHHVEGNVFFF